MWMEIPKQTHLAFISMSGLRWGLIPSVQLSSPNINMLLTVIFQSNISMTLFLSKISNWEKNQHRCPGKLNNKKYNEDWLSFSSGWWISGCPWSSSSSKLETGGGEEGEQPGGGGGGDQWEGGEGGGGGDQREVVRQPAGEERQLWLRKRWSVAKQENGSSGFKLSRDDDDSLVTKSQPSDLHFCQPERSTPLNEPEAAVKVVILNYSHQWPHYLVITVEFNQSTLMTSITA